MAKSELHSVGPSHIRFSDDTTNLTLEKNVGQAAFARSPFPKTDFLMVSIDGEDWYLNKRDAERMHAWLGEALK